MDRCRCPNDGMRIPQVAEFTDGDEPVRFFWCWSCAELFATVGGPGRDAAGFNRSESDRWQVVQGIGTEQDVRLAASAVTMVSPVVVTTRREGRTP
jgi:hypothetical protein